MTDAYAFSGWTRRWLLKRRGGFVESFALTISDQPRGGNVSDSQMGMLLDVFDFDAQPKLGPAIIYQRVVGWDPSHFDIDAFFDGNIAKDLTDASTVANIRAEGFMDENRFWAVISKATLSANDLDIEILVTELAQLGPASTMKFANSLAQRLLDLDHPLNANQDRDAIHKEPEEASLELRCFAISGGREAFTSLLRNPGSISWKPEMAGALEVLDAAAAAYETVAGGKVRIVTSAQYFTGANEDLWGMRFESRPRSRKVADDSDALTRWYAQYSPQLFKRLYGEPDAVWDGAAALSWRFRSSRVLVVGKQVRELVVLMSAPRYDTLAEVEASVVGELELPADERIAKIETMDSRWIRFTPGADRSIPNVFELTRKSKESEEAYLERYGFSL